MIDTSRHKGVLAWFAQNHVAANLLMLMIIVGGIISLGTNTVEMFPEMSVDIITVTVPYLGATPAEAEEAVCLRVEEAIVGRQSTRAFLGDKAVPRELILTILGTAGRAPSGSNIQPWKVWVVTGDAKDKLTRALLERHNSGDPGNREYNYYPVEWRESCR